MFHLFARISLMLIPVFTLLITSMAMIGSTQPLPSTLRGFVEGCEDAQRPCWFGIYTNTLSQDVDNLLTQAGYEAFDFGYDYIDPNGELCDVSLGYDPSLSGIYSFNLINCSFTLGDVIELFGTPVVVDAQYSDLVILYLADGTLVGVDTPLSLSSRIRFFDVSAYTTCSLDLPENAWHGFVPYWRYQQLEPNLEIICYSMR